MTTAARPTEERASHWYSRDGKACYEVQRADGKGTRKTTIADARKMGLLVSPTNLLRILAKPHLDSWRIEQACLAVLTAPRKPDEPLDAFVHRVLNVEQEHNAERDAAAEIGTLIHDSVECALNDVQFDPKFKPYVDAVMAEINSLGKVKMTERILCGDGHAGRTDCVLESDEFITVCDFKGTNKIPDKPYDEAVLQISSYCYSLGNTGDKRVRGAIIYIDRNNPGVVGTHIVKGEELERAYKRFRLILEYWRLTNNIQ